MALKLGRRPARHTRRTMRSALAMARALDPLGAPPAQSADYLSAVTVPWGMMLNDSLGCCVCSDTGHALMLRTANASGSIVVPSDGDIEKLYEVVGGFNPSDPQDTDNGCDETTMCEYLEATGFLGHRADAIGTVEPSNLDHLRWCVQLFGTCRLGVNLPQSAMDAIGSGQPWDVGGDATIVGGHDVPLVAYRGGGMFTCVTWGQTQDVTAAFILRYVEEAHAELFGDWINQQSGAAPSGFDLQDLVQRLGECT